MTVQWKRPEVNLTDLAKLRWNEGWSVERLAKHFERSPITMGEYLRSLRRGGLSSLKLDKSFGIKIWHEAKKEELQIQTMLKKFGR